MERRVSVKSVRLWFALAIFAAPLLLPAIALAQATASVTGTVDIRPRATLPSNALVTVQLADASRAGAQAQVIVEQTFMTNGAQGPFSFKLQYSPLQIAVNHVYIVQGNIKVGGQLRYTTTRPYPVITQGSPATATVIMDAIPLPNTSTGTQRLLAALLLAALLLLARLVRLRLWGGYISA
jgi:putative lipoprotein